MHAALLPYNPWRSPLKLLLWITISSIFAQYMGWWPNSKLGILSWLQMLPAFFAPAAPILFFVDW